MRILHSPHFQAVFTSLFLCTAVTSSALAAKSGLPTVHLDEANVIGSSFGNVSQFLGIPFAWPPVGNLRFNLPQPVAPYSGNLIAQEYGPSCLQQALSTLNITGFPNETLQVFNGLIAGANEVAEDCLSINVLTPASATPHSKLPVVAWIYGGGFQEGATISYNGSGIVERSIELKEPIIYVSMNYRVSALGFLASKEIEAAGAGNAGMLDQRLALQWIQKYISAFGGDPSKVTIWGESAGAMSVGFHMVANDGNTSGLFRGAVMSSGSPIPTGDLAEGQPQYDTLVSACNCSEAKDTLACLRAAPLEDINAAMQASPNLFQFASVDNSVWKPRVDGVLWKKEASDLVLEGKLAPVPFITGDCDDEGTLFILPARNLTTPADIQSYLQQFILPNASVAQVEKLLQLYPSDPSQGSPFGTGEENALTPVYKQFAAISGDILFQGARRLLLQNRLGGQRAWAYLNKRFKDVPIIGSYHGSDLVNFYGTGELRDYLIHFVNSLDPNGLNRTSNGNLTTWPQYSGASVKLLTFNDGEVPVNVTLDTYRLKPMEFVIELIKEKLVAF